MRRTAIALMAVIALVLGASVAMADPGKGRNNPKPENPPCDADHGHPQENADNKPGNGPKCPPDNGNGNGDPECPETHPIWDPDNEECVVECPDGTTTPGECPNGAEDACRATEVNLIDRTLVLFEANEQRDPCATDDGSVINQDQLRLLQAETDSEDTSADAEVLGLGGPDDPGQISVLGAEADCDARDAWLLKLSAGGEEQLKLGADEIPALAMDEDNGLVIGGTDETRARALELRLGGTDVLVVSEADAEC
jgi:hypothetical protein